MRSAASLLLMAGAFAVTTRAAALDVLLVDAQGKPVPDAAVLVHDGATAVPNPQASIDQIDKQFVPRASIVPVGSAVNFPNKDDIRHHVYSFSPARTFELKLYSGTPASPVLFDRTGIVVLGCNIHDGMVAFVYVVDAAHAALSDADGRVRVDTEDATTLEVWHPQLAAPVTAAVPADAAAQGLTVTLALDARDVAPPPLD